MKVSEAVRKARTLEALLTAERVLAIFERAFPADPRPRQAINTARAWAAGQASFQDVRQGALAAHAAARDAAQKAGPRAAAVAAARSCGQAAAVAHAAGHAKAASDYAAKALALLAEDSLAINSLNGNNEMLGSEDFISGSGSL